MGRTYRETGYVDVCVGGRGGASCIDIWGLTNGTYLDRWFVQMSQIWCCLTWLLAKHHSLGIDQAKGINYHLPFNTLNRVHHHSHCSLIQCFKTLHNRSFISYWSTPHEDHVENTPNRHPDRNQVKLIGSCAHLLYQNANEHSRAQSWINYLFCFFFSWLCFSLTRLFVIWREGEMGELSLPRHIKLSFYVLTFLILANRILFQSISMILPC